MRHPEPSGGPYFQQKETGSGPRSRVEGASKQHVRESGALPLRERCRAGLNRAEGLELLNNLGHDYLLLYLNCGPWLL